MNLRWLKANSLSNVRIHFYSPHQPQIQLHNEEFSLSVTLVPHRLQCYLILYTKIVLEDVSLILYTTSKPEGFMQNCCVVTAEAPYPVKVHIFVPHLVQLNLFNRHPQTHISDDKKHTFEGQKHTFYCFLISFAARLNVFWARIFNLYKF